ncbi:Predicted arabinose efflux permease, MFS family [Collimonas sp. OK307]|nr:Predicted arabinose efflux permease, MFS family [Collimonas sp. OK307]
MAYNYTSSGADASPVVNVTRRYAWLVFALTFGLLISDYMSRQVLNAVFPLIKIEWSLSDSQLGTLGGIVALMVGLLTFPLSLLADRWGRVKSLVLMAVLWSLATLACGLSQSYHQMFLARFFVGVGEAAYGSVGVALVLSVFPANLRSTLTAAFMAGGLIGSVLGVGFGGVLATHIGWRWAFGCIALFGLILAILFPLILKKNMAALDRPNTARFLSDSKTHKDQPAPLMGLFSTKSVMCAYVGSGLQLFIISALVGWMPSYLNRSYQMKPDKAGILAAAFLISASLGMVLCGIVCDRLGRNSPVRKVKLVIGFCIISGALLMFAFQLPVGSTQLIFIAFGMFFAAGSAGPAGAMVANLTSPAIHGTAFATLTLANNLLGFAPGPIVTGMLADRFGLQATLQLIPLVSIASTLVFMIGKQYYENDLNKVASLAAEKNIATC